MEGLLSTGPTPSSLLKDIYEKNGGINTMFFSILLLMCLIKASQ